MQQQKEQQPHQFVKNKIQNTKKNIYVVTTQHEAPSLSVRLLVFCFESTSAAGRCGSADIGVDDSNKIKIFSFSIYEISQIIFDNPNKCILG